MVVVVAIIALIVGLSFPAATAGLAHGDIITKVGSEVVTELDKLKKIYEAYEASPTPQLVEAQHDRHISLYVIKP